jgi:hypothetical protein
MAIFQINSLTLAISNLGVQSLAIGNSVTPALTVGYVDSAGTRQWLNVNDNVTTISGTAPFFVDFYGGNSVSTQANSDTVDEAFFNLGFLMNYGENLGGNWSLSGRPRDTDRGIPVFAHTYTTAGTHQARMTCRDSAGNQAFIRVNVVVSAPGAGVDMTSGVLPTFADNTVYNAPAGGTWPNITNQLDGRRNIIIRKTGSGADPVFGNVSLDSRNVPNTTITRSGGIRFLNCDVARVEWGGVGFDYCAFVGGRVRSFNPAPMEFLADELVANGLTELQFNNTRNFRGLMLQDTGVLGESTAPGYNFIGTGRGFHMKNVDSQKTSTGQNNIRGVFAYSSLRHCRFNNQVSSSGYLKFQGIASTLGSNLPDPWPDDDQVASFSEDRKLGLPCTRVAIVDNVFGQAGGVTPSANAGFGPQNNDVAPAEGCELSGMEHNRYFQTTQWFTIDMGGRGLSGRDNLLNLGAGANITVTQGTAQPNRIPPGWNGPYYVTNDRPVVIP